MPLPDLVYVVGEDPQNPELRYSLRSVAANFPHRTIWIAGHCPTWVRNVGRIPVRKRLGMTKYQSSTANLKAACEHDGVADEFLLWNDDFFAMRPLEGPMPIYHRGRVADVEKYYATRGGGLYLKGLRETRALLAELGDPDPLSYELHVPLPVNKSRMLDALAVGEGLTVVHKRTLYGALWRIGGTRLRDVKVMTAGARPDPKSPFVSTYEPSWAGTAGRLIRTAFPQPGPYEAGARAAAHAGAGAGAGARRARPAAARRGEQVA